MGSKSASYLDRLLTSLEVQVKGFALCRLQRGFELRLNGTEAPLIHYVLKGEGILRVEGASPVPFVQHDLILIPRRRPHAISAGDETLTRVSAPGDLAMIDDGLVALSAGDGADVVTACGIIDPSYGSGVGLFDPLRKPVAESLRNDDQLRAVMTSMVAELSRPTFGTRAIVEALLKQVLVLLIRRQLQGSGTESAWFLPAGDMRLAPVLEQMLKRPSGPHTLRSLAAAAGMSRSAFALRFLAAFGQPPMTFLRDLRLRHAARLLQVTDLPVEAIANSVGYTSRSYFSRAFRALFGIDPRSFRASRR